MWLAESVTVSTASNVPGFWYVWVGFCRELVGEPSPKFQEYVYGPVPPEALPENVTARGAVPDDGDAEPDAVNPPPDAPLTVMLTDACAVWLAESVTVRTAEYVPALW